MAAALGAAQPAVAAPQWLPPASAFDDTQANDVAGTMASDGTVAVARITATGALEVRVRPPGGALGPAATFDDIAANPRLIAGPSGHIALLWGTSGVEWVAVRPPGGSFGEPRRIGDQSNPGREQVAVDGSGRVWIARPDYTSGSVTTVAPDGDGRSFALDTVGGADWGTAWISLGVDGAGHVTIVYERSRADLGNADSTPCQVYNEIRVAEGDANGIADAGALAQTTRMGGMHLGGCEVNEEPVVGDSNIAVSADGTTLVTYALTTQTDVGEIDTQVVARVRRAGGAWPSPTSTPELVITSRSAPTVIPAFAGTTPIVALAHEGTGAIRLSARRGGSWSEPAIVATNGASFPLLAGSASGAATIAYVETSFFGARRVMAVVRQPSGAISAPVPISNTVESFIQPTGIGMDADGNALVAWLENQGSQTRSRFAGYDGAGPQLTASFPAGGTLGQPLPFSATALDVWTGTAAVSWSFGDGTSAGGTGATHAYSAVGTYPASVTARDGLGNPSVRSASVAVSEPPDTTRPAFRGRPSVSPKRVRRGIPATIQFNVSEAATVQAALTTRRRGVRSGTRCVAPRRRTARRGARRCKRTILLPTRSTARDTAGPGGIVLRTKRLKAGRYAIALTATDAFGNESSPVGLALTVLRRTHR